MSTETIFTKIIARQLPAYIVAEDARHIAFLDIAPVVRGHTLVVPKRPADYFFALEDKELQALICFTKKVALGIEKYIPCLRIGLKVYGLEVPHAHIHLIPITEEEDFTRQNSIVLTQDTMVAIAQGIRQEVGSLLEGNGDALQETGKI